MTRMSEDFVEAMVTATNAAQRGTTEAAVFVVKAGGEKGPEACRCTSRTFFADNADPRNLQPFAVNRGLGMASNCIHAKMPPASPEIGLGRGMKYI